MAPATYVLFGATGDLATRKILPSLCALMHEQNAPPLSFIASSRRPWGSKEYRDFLRPYLMGAPHIEEFLSRIEYHPLSFDDRASYRALKEKITSPALFHLAIEPRFYTTVAQGLGTAGFHGRLLIEKPFGQDAASARVLEEELEKYFKPDEILRIDHYLAKDGLRDFTLHLESRAISSVVCRILERLDIEGRGEFYDATGALRDVGQSHLLAMLATVLIPPGGTRAQALSQLEPVNPEEVLLGQYEGYRQEADVAPTSKTETYFRLIAHSRDPRWVGVPLYLEAGKALAEKKSEIEIQFTDGTSLIVPAVTPHLGEYALLTQAALAGEHMLFASFEEILAAWKFLAPILAHPSALQSYPKGQAPKW